MMLGVIPDLVPRSGGVPGQRGEPPHVPADLEEGRGRPARASDSRMRGVAAGLGPSSKVR